MKISIITITYNSQDTLQKTIDSVYQQEYTDIEYIVVDGNSVDGTLDIIEANSAKITHWVSEPDEGIYDAMNKGIKIATGDIIGMLNSDDTFHSDESLKKIAVMFEKHDPDCIYGNLNYINKIGEVTRKWRSKPFKQGMFEKSWTPAHPTFYCKKTMYEKFGVYKTDYDIAADVELMFRFLEVNKIESYFIDEVLVDMLEGGVSNSGLASTFTIIEEMKRAFSENELKLPILKYTYFKVLKMKERF